MTSLGLLKWLSLAGAVSLGVWAVVHLARRVEDGARTDGAKRVDRAAAQALAELLELDVSATIAAVQNPASSPELAARLLNALIKVSVSFGPRSGGSVSCRVVVVARDTDLRELTATASSDWAWDELPSEVRAHLIRTSEPLEMDWPILQEAAVDPLQEG